MVQKKRGQKVGKVPAGEQLVGDFLAKLGHGRHRLRQYDLEVFRLEKQVDHARSHLKAGAIEQKQLVLAEKHHVRAQTDHIYKGLVLVGDILLD